jgi:hypothetical protein
MDRKTGSHDEPPWPWLFKICSRSHSLRHICIVSSYGVSVFSFSVIMEKRTGKLCHSTPRYAEFFLRCIPSEWNPSGKVIHAARRSQTKSFEWEYTYENRILHHKSGRWYTGRFIICYRTIVAYVESSISAKKYITDCQNLNQKIMWNYSNHRCFTKLMRKQILPPHSIRVHSKFCVLNSC